MLQEVIGNKYKFVMNVMKVVEVMVVRIMIFMIVSNVQVAMLFMKTSLKTKLSYFILNRNVSIVVLQGQSWIYKAENVLLADKNIIIFMKISLNVMNVHI
jgi:hypothetical protein